MMWLFLAKGIARLIGALSGAVGFVGIAVLILSENSGMAANFTWLIIASFCAGILIVSVTIIYVWRACGFRLRRTARSPDVSAVPAPAASPSASPERARLHFAFSLALLLVLLAGVGWQAIKSIPLRARLAKEMHWRQSGFNPSFDSAGRIESLAATRYNSESMAAPGFDPIAALAEIPETPTIIISDPQADLSLRELAKCKSIHKLVLAGSGVTDSGLALVAEMSGLESLDLSRTGVGDAGIAYLNSLRNLRRLDLSSVGTITAAVADHLATFPKLEWLKLPQNAVTVESLNRIQRALPKLQIDADN